MAYFLEGTPMLMKKLIILSALLGALSMNCHGMQKTNTPADQKQLKFQSQLDSALFIAVSRGDAALVEKLLANNANPFRQKKDGQSAFLTAYEHESPAVICLMYRVGRFPKDVWLIIKSYVEGDVARAKSIQQFIHFSCAYREKNLTLMRHIVRKKFEQWKLDLALNNASLGNVYVEYDTLFVAKALLKLGADANALGYVNKPCIMRAADSGSIEFIEELLKAGADVNALNSNGGTALTSVASNCLHVNAAGLITLLLAAGANPHIRETESRMTALDYAKKDWRDFRAKKVIELLEAAEKSYQPKN